MSVGFADKKESYYIKKGYSIFESELGKVYIPTKQVELSDEIAIRYEKYPWVECFEVDGVKAKPPKKKKRRSV